MDASSTFWDGESHQIREGILLSLEMKVWDADELAKKPFAQLGKTTQRAVARQIGEILAK